MGTTEQIRVSPELKERLRREKREGESYNDVVERLVARQTERRREAIQEGAGLWNDSEAAGHARRAREEMNEELGPDR
jgi:predicted CopG family antitoxin